MLHAIVVLWAATALTAPEPVAPDLDARLAFLGERLEIQRTHATWWWTSVMGVYSGGMVVQSVRTSLATEQAERVDLLIGAIKAAGGVLRYGIQPFGGIGAAPPASPAPGAPADDALGQVLRAEQQLLANAAATDPFGAWYVHLSVVVVNIAGAVIVGAGFGDWSAGLISAGIGIGVGELALFTQPWEADDDLAEYRQRFGGLVER